MEDDVEVELELEKQLSLAHEMFWHQDGHVTTVPLMPGQQAAGRSALMANGHCNLTAAEPRESQVCVEEAAAAGGQAAADWCPTDSSNNAAADGAAAAKMILGWKGPTTRQ